MTRFPAVCYGSNVCGVNFACPGGSACNTTCNPGYQLVGSQCLRMHLA